MLIRGILVLSLALVCSTVAQPHRMDDEVGANYMPAPFTRVLFLKKPPFEGKQIITHVVGQLTETRKWGFKTDVTAAVEVTTTSKPQIFRQA